MYSPEERLRLAEQAVTEFLSGPVDPLILAVCRELLAIPIDQLRSDMLKHSHELGDELIEQAQATLNNIERNGMYEFAAGMVRDVAGKAIGMKLAELRVRLNALQDG
jgi:hypothetical protein